MSCQICFHKFDHSSLKPYQLSCAHTYCLNCASKLDKCPTCNERIIEKHQNLALLEFIPELNNNVMKVNEQHNQAKLSCQICMEKYDHSKFKPYNLSCPHTFCLNCTDRIQKCQKCPVCSKEVTSRYPNLALLDFIQESEYDILKREITKILNETNETKSNLKIQQETRVAENMRKLEFIKANIEKTTIDNVCDEVFVALQTNKTKLINEIDHLQMKIKETLDLYIVSDSIDDELSQNKIKLDLDQLSNQELLRLKPRFEAMEGYLINQLKEILDFNESHEFILNENIDPKKPMVGQFKTTYYNKVSFFLNIFLL